MLKTAKISSNIDKSICRGHLGYFYIAQMLLYKDF